MTNTTTTNKFNPLPGKLMLVINELYPAEVISIWNDYCKSIDDTDHCIHWLCGDKLNEVLKDWHQVILFSVSIARMNVMLTFKSLRALQRSNAFLSGKSMTTSISMS